jgi:ferredoxin
MAIKTLAIDRDQCIGAASCVAVYPDVFEIDDEAKAVLKLKG